MLKDNDWVLNLKARHNLLSIQTTLRKTELISAKLCGVVVLIFHILFNIVLVSLCNCGGRHHIQAATLQQILMFFKGNHFL